VAEPQDAAGRGCFYPPRPGTGPAKCYRADSYSGQAGSAYGRCIAVRFPSGESCVEVDGRVAARHRVSTAPPHHRGSANAVTDHNVGVEQGFEGRKLHSAEASQLCAKLRDLINRGPGKDDVEALNGAVTKPAWQSKPSCYLVATDDRMIPPPAQRFMAKRAGSSVVEIKGSHAVYVSQPEAIAELIGKAAKSIATK